MMFLDFLRSWCLSLESFLPTQGIELRFGATDDDRNKASGWVTILRGEREAELLVWDTGEAEYAAGGGGADLEQRHYDLTSVVELAGVLGLVLEAVSRD
jgi:hypothetical protein